MDRSCEQGIEVRASSRDLTAEDLATLEAMADRIITRRGTTIYKRGRSPMSDGGFRVVITA